MGQMSTICQICMAFLGFKDGSPILQTQPVHVPNPVSTIPFIHADFNPSVWDFKRPEGVWYLRIPVHDARQREIRN